VGGSGGGSRGRPPDMLRQDHDVTVDRHQQTTGHVWDEPAAQGAVIVRPDDHQVRQSVLDQVADQLIRAAAFQQGPVHPRAAGARLQSPQEVGLVFSASASISGPFASASTNPANGARQSTGPRGR